MNTKSDKLSILMEGLESRTHLAAGGLDPSFSSDGRVLLTTGGSVSDIVANDVAVQGDGKSVVAGYETVSGARRMVVARFRFDGSIDTSFHLGKSILDFKRVELTS